MSIEINNETEVDIDEARVLRLAGHALKELNIHPKAELAIQFIDEEPMEVLHIQWMDEPGPTDVLSFPMDELRPGSDSEISGPGLLGDIVVCPQVAATQAVAAGHETINEILLLTTHGILHLLGFDHAEPDEEKEMFGLQREILDAESVAGHLLKAGSVFGFLAAHRRELFPDAMFSDLFPTGRGRPSVPADVMAAVITLQAFIFMMLALIYLGQAHNAH